MISEPDDDVRAWRLLVADFDERLRAYQAADKTGPMHRAAARALWQSTAELFRFYASNTNWREFYDPEYEEDTPRFALPADASLFIANCADMIQQGRTPAVVAAVRAKGRIPPSADEVRDIAIAAAYVHAVRGKHIEDAHPIATVCERFGVTRNTVSSWVRKASEFDPDRWALPEELAQAFARAAARYKRAR